MLPMIAASRPVTSSETTVKMPSLMPAEIVVALRELIGAPPAGSRTSGPYISEPEAPYLSALEPVRSASSALTICCSPALPE